MRKRMRLFNVLVIAFVIIAAGLITLNRLEQDITVLQDNAREARQQEVDAITLNGKLSLEASRKDDKEYVVDIARSQYDYLMPGEIRFEVINPEVLGIEEELKEAEEMQ